MYIETKTPSAAWTLIFYRSLKSIFFKIDHLSPVQKQNFA